MRRLASILSVVLLAAPSCDLDPRCTIIIDSAEFYRHELAHCNGWEHPPFEVADPPAEYVHDYSGKLTVIKCGRRHQCKSARRQCLALWKEKGVDLDAYRDKPGWANVRGCSYRGY